MENSEKIYLANLKASEKFGEQIIEGALNISQINLFLDKYAYSPKNSEDQFINIKIVKRKKASKFNHTHYIELDTFKPEKKDSKETSAD